MDKKPIGYWTKERCYNEAKKYTTKSEFQRNNPSAYRKSLDKGWLSSYTWFISLTKPFNYWTYQKCEEESKKYKTRSEFQDKNSSAYRASCENGWICDFVWLINGTKYYWDHHAKWTESSCYEEAKKYSSRSEFQRNNESAYNKARRKGWLESYFWLKNQSFDLYKDEIDMIYAYEFIEQNAVYVGRTLARCADQRDKEHIFKNDSVSNFAKEHNIPVPKMKILENDLLLVDGVEREGYWVEKYKKDGWVILNKTKTGSIGGLGKSLTKKSYNYCLSEAKKYTELKEFRTKSKDAYNASLKYGWLTDFVWLKVSERKQHRWTEDMCLDEAKKYTNKHDFITNSKNAYKAAWRYGWLYQYYWLV